MENEIKNNENSKSKTKKIIFIIVFLMILGIGVGIFIFLNNNKWNFELDKKEEFCDLSYKISSRWRTFENNKTDGITKFYYPFEKNEDGIIMIDITKNYNEAFKPEEFENAKIDNSVLSGFISGLTKESNIKIDSSNIKNINNTDMGYVKYNDEKMQYITYFWLNHNIVNSITIGGKTW